MATTATKLSMRFFHRPVRRGECRSPFRGATGLSGSIVNQAFLAKGEKMPGRILAFGAAPIAESAEPAIAIFQIGIGETMDTEQSRGRVGQAVAPADEPGLPLIAVDDLSCVETAILDDAIHVGELTEGSSARNRFLCIGGGADEQHCGCGRDEG